MTALTDPAAEAAIDAACPALHLPTIRAEATRIADAAARKPVPQGIPGRSPHRRVRRPRLPPPDPRVNEAKFPRTKRLADFDHPPAPTCPRPPSRT